MHWKGWGTPCWGEIGTCAHCCSSLRGKARMCHVLVSRSGLNSWPGQMCSFRYLLSLDCDPHIGSVFKDWGQTMPHFVLCSTPTRALHPVFASKHTHAHTHTHARTHTHTQTIQGYGLTETCAASFISNPFDNRHLGTVGAPLAHTDLRLEAVPDMG
eukprot:1152901-Pelagomonas_calceolata.AAC.20